MALKHKDTPFIAKIIAAVVVAYALSHIDLIHDFIPVIGLLDDVIIIPALIAVAVNLIPVDVFAECKKSVCRFMDGKQAEEMVLCAANHCNMDRFDFIHYKKLFDYKNMRNKLILLYPCDDIQILGFDVLLERVDRVVDQLQHPVDVQRLVDHVEAHHVQRGQGVGLQDVEAV